LAIVAPALAAARERHARCSREARADTPVKEGGLMISQRIWMTVLVGGLGALAAPTRAHAQALPTPLDLISGLDLECYRTPGPSIDKPLLLTQLNPVLLTHNVPAQQVMIRDLAQTCVPVQKNGTPPSATALPFVRQIDFACYHIDAPPLPVPVDLTLTHLNPVLADQLQLPKHDVTLTQATQLCVPVAKNNKPPEGEVLRLAQFIDLECFETDPEPHPQFTVNLTQLNPQLTGILPHPMTLVSKPRHLCVPVQKGNQNIPMDIKRIVRFIDLEKFLASPPVNIAPVTVTLSHLNPLPLFQNLPKFQVTLETAISLMVPVQKNNSNPPND
jgi:hypothetical protein